MESSNQRREVFDPVRKKWVKSTPEEMIRQGWIQKMTQELGFPLALLSVEKELSTFHSEKAVPKRRLDILAFAGNEKGLFPLLMIECKALPLTPKFAGQVIGYNSVVKAPFIACANASNIVTGRFCPQKKIFVFSEGLGTYDELLSCL